MAQEGAIVRQHFLQSPAWEDYEHSEGRKTFRISGEGFSVLAILESTPLGYYLFCPYGPTVDSDKSGEAEVQLRNALDSLTKLACEQGAFFIRLEPTIPFSSTVLTKIGLKKSHDLDPAHTWVLDLTQSEEKIFADMEKEKGRLWRNCYKKEITVRKTNDPTEIGVLTAMLGEVGDKNHFIPQKEKHLSNQMKAGFATLYVAELKDKPIAAALVYDYDGVRYYAHAAADYEHRKLAAGSILLVQMIVDAKHAGMQSFDFWGITTSTDKKHPWYGFTEFKKSFGGEQVDYAGTWDLPVKKCRYCMYKIIRKANRVRRKVWRRK